MTHNEPKLSFPNGDYPGESGSYPVEKS